MENFNVYKDTEARTNGEIYIGVVGPVRTGEVYLYHKDDGAACPAKHQR